MSYCNIICKIPSPWGCVPGLACCLFPRRARSVSRAPIRRKSASGKKGRKSPCDKTEVTNRRWGGGEESLLKDPGSELRLGREREEGAKIIHGKSKRKKLKQRNKRGTDADIRRRGAPEDAWYRCHCASTLGRFPENRQGDNSPETSPNG